MEEDELYNYYLIALGVLVIIFLAISPLNHAPAQSIMPGVGMVSFGDTMSAGADLPENPGAVAFQSMAFSVSSFTADITSFNEGIGPLMKLWLGIPVLFWAIVIGIIAVNILLSFVKVDIKEIKEKNQTMHLMNLAYILIPLMSYLALGFLLTSFSQAALFYLIFIAIPIAFLAFLRRYAVGLQIAVNDKIMFFLDITSSTQALITMFCVIGIFSVMSMTQASYSAFAISGETISRLAVVSPEDQALNYVPSMVMLLIGSLIWLGVIASWHDLDIDQVLHVDLNYIFDIINKWPRAYFSGMVVIVLCIATFQGYVGAFYHINAYTGIAAKVAYNWNLVNPMNPITEEQAMQMTINSVSTFWSMGSLGSMLSGNIFPLHLVHGYINLVAQV